MARSTKAAVPKDRRVGLIGYPVRHSISPVFQQAAFDFYSLPVRYETWETSAEELPVRLESLRHPEFLGCNVTIPHKQSVMAALDTVDDRARQIGAVNTIVNHLGRLEGHNTDVDGFIRALREQGQMEPIDKTVVVLGAGGAARAAVLGLLWEDAASVTIFNRTGERAEALADSARLAVPGARVQGFGWDEAMITSALAEADLLVNATPVGMKHTDDVSPLPASAIPEDILVYDLIYNPSQTPLLEAASKAGARTLNGLPMLVYQGAAAFELWTTRKAPVGLMMRRAADALS